MCVEYCLSDCCLRKLNKWLMLLQIGAAERLAQEEEAAKRAKQREEARLRRQQKKEEEEQRQRERDEKMQEKQAKLRAKVHG